MRLRSKKKKWGLYYAGKLEDVDEMDVLAKSFLKMSPAEKFIETWKLTETLIELQGRDPNELRFDRTTLILKRL